MYGDYESKFDELLKKDGSFGIHHRNVQTSAIAIFSHLNALSPEIMKEVFQVSLPATCYLREKNEFTL